MAKQKQEEAGVSLFPFMSILVCLIGGLTLMISILTITQAGQEQSQEVIDRYHEYTKLKADMEHDAAELEKLRQMIAQAEKLREQARLALQEAMLLEKKQKEQAERSGALQYQQILVESNRLRQRIAEIEPEPAKLQKSIEDLKKEIKKRNAGPEEAIVQIRPGGSGVDVAPTFVECATTGVVIHEGKEPQRIRAGDLAKEDGDFRKLLDRVAGTPKGQVIFLLRPDAVGTYNVAREVARTHFGPNGYCKNGKLPVPSQGNIDLSIFRR
jgi:cell division protein FtsB